jgi:hypothetical protein
VIFNVSDPILGMFHPAPGHANGTAVIIAHGGAFVGLAYEGGGTAIARQLARRGVTALVLKYRTVRSPDTAMHMPAVHMKEMELIMARAKSGLPLEVPRFAGEKHAVEDGARAMTLVRASSGAFLAVDLAIGNKLTRPDFVGLIYGGLRTPVPTDASPAFIAAAADDAYLPGDSMQLYAAWRRSGVPAGLHVYERGGHGFELDPKGTTSDHWFDKWLWWMQSRGLMPAPVKPAPGRGR